MLLRSPPNLIHLDGIRHSSCAVCVQGKVLCRADKIRKLPGDLFAPATINLSMFTRVMISLWSIYYTYALYYLILAFLCMKCAVIEWIWKVFRIINNYLQAKLRVGRTEFIFSVASDEIICHHSSTFAVCIYSESSAECNKGYKAQCVPGIKHCQLKKIAHLKTLSSNLLCESAAEHYTAEQCSKAGKTKLQKVLTSRLNPNGKFNGHPKFPIRASWESPSKYFMIDRPDRSYNTY